MTVVPLAAAAMTAVAALGAIAPFALSRTAIGYHLADPLDDERLRVLRRLRELDEEFASGALEPNEYQALRNEIEVSAVALLRGRYAQEGTGELARAVKRPRRPDSAAAAEDHGRLLPGVLLAFAVVAGTVPFLVGALASRGPGGLITGQPPAAARSAPASTELAFFEARVREHPNDVAARLLLGQQYLAAGDLEGASRQYVEVLAIDPANKEAHTRMGALIYAAGLPDRALTAVDKALEVDPAYPEALYMKGVILLRGLHRSADAASAFRAYLNAAPFGSHRQEVEQLLTEAGGGS